MSSWGTVHFRGRKSTSPTDAVVCCIAKDEEPYIDEWVQYHLLLGFSHVYIYDNSDTNTLREKQSSSVTVIHFPGRGQQLKAYDNFASIYKKQHKWVAIIDCDEFIVLKNHATILEFLKEYNQYSSIGLNWRIFGTSFEHEYRDEPVTKRFTYCSKEPNYHVKCISKIDSIYYYTDPHTPFLIHGTIVDTNGKQVKYSIHTDANYDVASIHHYYTKSEGEFVKKINRGHADSENRRSMTEADDIHSKYNDVVNMDAWNFYSTKT